MPEGFSEGDGSLINWVSDVSCVKEGIRSVAVVKGVRFIMCLRVHGTEELVDEGSFTSGMGMRSRLLWDIGR